ncbi:MAG TPA: hypothetical protein PKC62_08480 [Ferruginibacter sp.]|jgi:hypothetical protein|nr:hypothetical protein [Bacteroidota bacterium]MCC6692999.1 hypothetical protein [Chitinophagaceae bacterium]HMT96708.1 hypothetical protein [Ferruginibacter sp.]MBS1925133.1 hypothetical protein [Bacteroidota bacterium]HMU24889.1 hypothetical protein [Ferruginibacter sp.]
MSATCSFTVPFTGNADEIFNKAKNVVENQGGTFNGDARQGNFYIEVFGNKIAGDYSVAGNELSINITDKPFFVPCATIENLLKSKLS